MKQGEEKVEHELKENNDDEFLKTKEFLAIIWKIKQVSKIN